MFIPMKKALFYWIFKALFFRRSPWVELVLPPGIELGSTV
jgi:hypothetical protein